MSSHDLKEQPMLEKQPSTQAVTPAPATVDEKAPQVTDDVVSSNGTDTEKGALAEEDAHPSFYARHQRLVRPVVLFALAALILGWWISSTILPATRHRCVFLARRETRCRLICSMCFFVAGLFRLVSYQPSILVACAHRSRAHMGALNPYTHCQPYSCSFSSLGMVLPPHHRFPVSAQLDRHPSRRSRMDPARPEALPRASPLDAPHYGMALPSCDRLRQRVRIQA